jgi:hypothetical protein
VDTSAIIIKVMEKLYLVKDVRWPDAALVALRRVPATT